VGVSKPECIDCRAAENRPAVPRPIDPRSGPRKPRCATHYRAALAAVCVNCRAIDDSLTRVRPIDPRSEPDKPRCATHYRADLLSRTMCVDCRAVESPGEVRPIDPRSGPGKPRCTTHHRAAKRAVKTKRQAYYLEQQHGITEEEYWELYEKQGRKCALPRCRATGKVKRLAVDHDHDMAEQVCGHARDRSCKRCRRGLVCGPHNYDLLGKFAGDLRDALDYLADPPARRLA
jgi:hypothetical protein